MGIWTDLAEWVGPTPNRGGAMIEWRGVVLHIAEGSYQGTIDWQHNPTARVSSHFIVAKDGRCAQMVDTDQVAWTQAQGNGHWLSIENEGFAPVALTPQQFEVNAQLIARGAKIYGYPLQVTDSTSGQGLGWHGMGGTAWGGHPDCPGEPIKAQRSALLVRAQQILNGGTPAPEPTPDEEDEDMRPGLILEDANSIVLMNFHPVTGEPYIVNIGDGVLVSSYQALGWQHRKVNSIGIYRDLGTINDEYLAALGSGGGSPVTGLTNHSHASSVGAVIPAE